VVHSERSLLHATTVSTPSPDLDLAAETRRAADAAEVADAAAAHAGVRTEEVEEMVDLRTASRLWESVWGRNDEGAPIGSEVLRSLVHAGGAVTVARGADGEIIGAAALALAADSTTYSLIAAAAAKVTDRGIGRALKLRQRAWALHRGLMTMHWTFDPLVGRNARFNLTKLGAVAHEYVPRFYGRMVDQINDGDESDRLVAAWRLDSSRAAAAAEDRVEEVPEPDAVGSTVRLLGPDGDPAYLSEDEGAWCRVPRDVVALRGSDPAAAASWRAVVRDALTDAFGAGLTATGMTRSGWYRLSRDEAR
jgi:predicted GNAT superfamily acetyltransferase